MQALDVASLYVPLVEPGHLAYGNDAVVATCPSPVISDQLSKVTPQLISTLIPCRRVMAPARALSLSDQEASLAKALSSTPPRSSSFLASTILLLFVDASRQKTIRAVKEMLEHHCPVFR
jgi:hypothetical protein